MAFPLTLLLIALAPRPGQAHMGPHLPPPGVLLTRDAALRNVFQSANIERQTAYLTEDQAALIEKLAGSRFESRVVSYYVGKAADKVLGFAFFDTHRIRDGKETIMVVVSPDGKVRHVEVLAFTESGDFLPPRSWLDKLKEKSLAEIRWSRENLPNVTGLMLSTQALTDAARQLVAAFEVLVPRASVAAATPQR